MLKTLLIIYKNFKFLENNEEIVNLFEAKEETEIDRQIFENGKLFQNKQMREIRQMEYNIRRMQEHMEHDPQIVEDENALQSNTEKINDLLRSLKESKKNLIDVIIKGTFVLDHKTHVNDVPKQLFFDEMKEYVQTGAPIEEIIKKSALNYISQIVSEKNNSQKMSKIVIFTSLLRRAAIFKHLLIEPIFDGIDIDNALSVPSLIKMFNIELETKEIKQLMEETVLPRYRFPISLPKDVLGFYFDMHHNISTKHKYYLSLITGEKYEAGYSFKDYLSTQCPGYEPFISISGKNITQTICGAPNNVKLNLRIIYLNKFGDEDPGLISEYNVYLDEERYKQLVEQYLKADFMTD